MANNISNKRETRSDVVVSTTNGIVSVNGGVNNSGNAIADINTLTSLVGNIDTINDKLVLYDKSTGKHVQISPSSVGVIPNVRYGTTIPTILATDNKGDEYLITPSGDNTTTATDSYLFDGTVWIKRSANSTRTIQQLNTTGTVIAWNSIVEIGATSLTSNITITLPANGADTIGKDIIFKRLDNTSFTVTLIASGSDTLQVNRSAIELNTQYGALTISSVSATKSEQTSNIDKSYINGLDVGYVVGWTANTTPPDFLLPLNGGTYNKADYPDLIALHLNHPNQFFASQTSLTFTLKNINTSGRFLRGGTTAGVDQTDSTKTPNAGWTVSGAIANGTTNPATGTTTQGQFGLALSSSGGSNTVATADATLGELNLINSPANHTHTVTGGDSETRPVNTSVIWCLKAKSVSTSGSLTINNTFAASADYIKTARITTQQVNVTTASDLILNSNTVGNIPYNTTTGVYTLTAGKTYSLSANLEFLAFSATTSWLKYEWVDAVTNNVLQQNGAGISLPFTATAASSQQTVAEIIYTPSVDQTVKLRTTGGSGTATLNSNNASWATITQIGSTPTLANTFVNIPDLPTGGVIITGTVDPYVVGYNVTQITSGQVVSLPNPTTTSVNRIIYVNNTGTSAFQINGLIISAGQSQAFIWNGTAWSNFSNNTNQNVLSEYGENNSITHNGTFSTTLTDIPGSTFIIPSAGTWEVAYTIQGRNSAVAISYISIYDSNNNIVPTSTSESTTYTAGFNDGYQQTGKVIITTTAATKYKLRGITNGGTFTIQNVSQSTNASSGGNSKISWVKLGGFLPISGTAATTQTIFNGAYNTATVGNIGNTGGTTFTVSNTGTYEFTCQGSGFTTTANITRTGTYQIRQGTNVITTGTVNFYFNTASVHTVIPTSVFFSNLTAGITYNIIWNVGTFNCDINDFFLVTAKQVGSSPISTFSGSTATSAGTNGYLPAPAAGTQELFLKGDGTWSGAIANITNNTTNLQVNNALGDTITSFIFPDVANGNNSVKGYGYAFIRGGRVFAVGTNWKSQNGSNFSNEIHEVQPNLYKNKGTGTAVGYTPIFKYLTYNSLNGYAIDQNNKVWIAGDNGNSQFGDGGVVQPAVNNMFYLMDYFTTNNINIVSISPAWSNQSYAFFISDVGDVYFCGYNAYGQGSNGTATNVTTPTKITAWGTTLKVVKMVTGGAGAGTSGCQAFFILTDGSLWGCGWNGQSQVGDGTTTQVNTAKQLVVSNVIDVACGGFATGIVKADGTVWHTGQNGYGHMGNNNVTNTTVWTKSSTFPVTALAKEIYISCNTTNTTWSAVRTTTNEIYFAGVNYNGVFGEGIATAQGNFTSYFKPTASFQGNIDKISHTAMTAPSMAILNTNGDVFVAGDNQYGAKGQGNATTTFLYQNTWHQVPNYSKYVYIWGGSADNSAGASVAAVNARGQLYNWGDNQSLASGLDQVAQLNSPQFVKLDNSVAPVPVAYTNSTVNYNGTTAGLVSVSPNSTGVMAGSSTWTSVTGLNVDNTNNRVGIGTNSPQTKLSIINSGTSAVVPVSGGGEIISDSVNPKIYLEHSGAVTGSRVSAISDVNGVWSVDSYNDSASLFVKQNIIAANHLTGNVGIGTGVPSSQLHISDNSSAATPTIEISGTNTSAFGTLTATQLDAAGLFIHQAAVGGIGSVTSFIAGGKTTGNFPSDIRFLTTASGGTQPTEKLTIRRDGNIGIGITNPSSSLHITGSMAITPVLVSTTSTQLTTHSIIELNSSTSITYTLLATTGLAGRIINITNTNTTAVNHTVTGTINGSVKSITLSPFETLELQVNSTSTSWNIKKAPPVYAAASVNSVTTTAAAWTALTTGTWTETSDNYSALTNSTFTVPVGMGGLYQLEVMVGTTTGYLGVNTNEFLVGFGINGNAPTTGLRSGGENEAAITANHSRTYSTITRLNSGDIVIPHCFTTVARTFVSAGNFQTYVRYTKIQ